MNIVTMIDAEGINAWRIPSDTAKVAGYVTGSGGVLWVVQNWSLFPHAGHVRIDQSPAGALFGSGAADVYDIEALAGQVDHVAGLVHQRIAKGVQWSTLYGTDSTLAACKAALDAGGPAGWYNAHVDCWLADWNLNAAEAGSKIGTLVHGLTCRAVQWASPSSNPATVIPGTATTLAQANVDLSVADESWHPAASAPPPPPPPPAELEGILVQLPGGAARKVLSSDGGKTWA